MTENRLGEIRAIQKQIVSALEQGDDISELSRHLARVRAEIAAEAEIQELKKIADARQALRDKAEAVKIKVLKQGEAIDTFLKARDTLISQLQPLIEPMRELAKMQAPSWEKEPGECYIFNDIKHFAATVREIPEGYLPATGGCPFLEMKDGTQKADGKAAEAYSYLQWCYGILASFRKGTSALPLRPAEGLMAIDNESESETGSCIVCQHQEREAIDKALKEGVPLRTIEAGHGVSRSSLSRHKNNCLNLGAIKLDESPAASSNATFFR